jgi:hypothetical protein
MGVGPFNPPVGSQLPPASKAATTLERLAPATLAAGWGRAAGEDIARFGEARPLICGKLPSVTRIM